MAYIELNLHFISCRSCQSGAFVVCFTGGGSSGGGVRRIFGLWNAHPKAIKAGDEQSHVSQCVRVATITIYMHYYIYEYVQPAALWGQSRGNAESIEVNNPRTEGFRIFLNSAYIVYETMHCRTLANKLNYSVFQSRPTNARRCGSIAACCLIHPKNHPRRTIPRRRHASINASAAHRKLRL